MKNSDRMLAVKFTAAVVVGLASCGIMLMAQCNGGNAILGLIGAAGVGSVALYMHLEGRN